MSSGTKQKKQRTGANTLLLAQNEREGVAICSEPRRRRDAPANDAAEGEPSSSGGKGKGKASTATGKSVDIGDPPVSNNDFISKLLSASVDGLGNLQVVGCSSHSYGAPPAPPPKIMHDTELGLSLYSDCDMDSKTYVNVTGPGARISQAVDKDALNVFAKTLIQQYPEMINDLTQTIWQPKSDHGACECETKWHSSMFGRNNSGSVLFIYFPDKRIIPDVETCMSKFVFPGCENGSRPMNVCFFNEAAFPKCKCIAPAMEIIMRDREKVSMMMVAMYKPTGHQFQNTKTSESTLVTLQANANSAKMYASQKMTSFEIKSLHEQVEKMQKALDESADVIRVQRIDNQSNRLAMFCVAVATQQPGTLQEFLRVKDEFMGLLNTTQEDADDSTAGGSVGASADASPPECAEMKRLFLDLVQSKLDNKTDGEMLGRIMSTELVKQEIEKQVAARVEALGLEVAEDTVKVRIAEAVKAKEGEIEARIKAEVCRKLLDTCVTSLSRSKKILSDMLREQPEWSDTVRALQATIDTFVAEFSQVIDMELPKDTTPPASPDVGDPEGGAETRDPAQESADVVDEPEHVNTDFGFSFGW